MVVVVLLFILISSAVIMQTFRPLIYDVRLMFRFVLLSFLFFCFVFTHTHLSRVTDVVYQLNVNFYMPLSLRPLKL